MSQSPWAELYTLVAQALTTQQHADATAALTALAQRPGLPPFLSPVLTALQALLAGSRDPALTDNPHLVFWDTAELRLLLDQFGTA